MAMIQSRRRLLGGMALAVPAALLPFRRAAAVEPPPETTTVRFSKHPVICFAPQYVCEELLRAEGFTDIRWVDIPIPSVSRELGSGQIDFASDLSRHHRPEGEKSGRDRRRGAGLADRRLGRARPEKRPHPCNRLRCYGAVRCRQDRRPSGVSSRSARAACTQCRPCHPKNRHRPAVVAIFLLRLGG